MKSAVLLVAAAGLVAAQNFGGEPACAIPCLTSAIIAAGCALNDQACQCGTGQPAIATKVAPCLATACVASDLLVAASVGGELCSAYSASLAHVPATTTAARATTTSGAVTATTTVPASAPPETISSVPVTTVTAVTTTVPPPAGTGSVTVSSGGAGIFTNSSRSGSRTSSSSVPSATPNAATRLAQGMGFAAILGAIVAVL